MDQWHRLEIPQPEPQALAQVTWMPDLMIRPHQKLRMLPWVAQSVSRDKRHRNQDNVSGYAQTIAVSISALRTPKCLAMPLPALIQREILPPKVLIITPVAKMIIRNLHRRRNTSLDPQTTPTKLVNPLARNPTRPRLKNTNLTQLLATSLNVTLKCQMNRDLAAVLRAVAAAPKVSDNKLTQTLIL